MSRFSIEAIFKAVDRFTRPLARMQTRTAKFQDVATRGLLAVGKSAVNLVGRFGQIAVAAAAAGAAIGAIALAKNIIDVGSDFEQAIVNVGAVGLQTREQIAALEQKALDLGATTKFTATEAANAMEIMARAGFKNEEILSGVEGVLSAAAASGLEMAEVADVMSNVLKGMGLEASQAGRVADVLSLASARTNSTIGSLGESMKNLSPVARQMGVSLEEAVASVALLQDVGLDASEAGTATATMLTKLTKPIPEVEKKMKQLGIAFKDAQGNALPLPKILAQFDKAAKKSGGNMEVVAFFADLVGLRGQKAALNLKDMFASGKLSSLTEELSGAAGKAKEMSDLRMKSLQGDWELLASAVDGVKISLFQMEGGPLRRIVQTLTAWVEANDELIKQKFEGFANFVTLVAEKLPEWIPIILKIGKFLGGLTAALGVVLGVLLAAWAVLMAVILAPLVALVAAWAFFPKFFTDLWESVKAIVSGAGDFIVAVGQGIIDFHVGMWRFIKGLAILAWEGIANAFAPVTSFFSTLWGGVTTFFREKFGGFAPYTTGVVDKVKAAWASLKEFFASLWNSVVQTFEEKLGPIFDTISKFIEKVQSVGAGGIETAQGGAAALSPNIVGATTALRHELRETREKIDVSIHTDPGTKATVKRSKGKRGGLNVKPTGDD